MVFVTERCVVQTPQVELVICLVKKSINASFIPDIDKTVKLPFTMVPF